MLKLLLFIVTIIIIDQILGVGFKTLLVNAKGGYQGRNNYIINKSNEDILIFGSSKASHHYVPSIFEDSLDMSCYNCGQDGNGIFYSYPVIMSIFERYNPKIVILDIIPEFDLIKYKNNQQYITALQLYYGQHSSIDSVINSIDSTMKFKLMLKSYQNNSKFASLVMGVMKKSLEGENGYLPLIGTFKGALNSQNTKYEFDKQKLKLLEKFIVKTKKRTRLYVVVSPAIEIENIDLYEPVKEMCLKYNVPFLFFGDKHEFIANRELFKDALHLNIAGSELFSSQLSHVLKEIYIK